LGSNTVRVAANTSGSCRRTQSSFGAVKPGMAMLPARAVRSGTSRCSSAHSAPLRPSFHRIAGRSTRPAPSSSVAPCIWPESPIAVSARLPSGAAARTSATAASVACHQCSGSCSDHNGCGRETSSAALPTASVRCAASISSALTEDVPISSPRNVTESPPAPAVARQVAGE
jgi:hypothetical protein